eukprot:1192309-Prorocentrum_minimum.AAC.3
MTYYAARYEPINRGKSVGICLGSRKYPGTFGGRAREKCLTKPCMGGVRDTDWTIHATAKEYFLVQVACKRCSAPLHSAAGRCFCQLRQVQLSYWSLLPPAQTGTAQLLVAASASSDRYSSATTGRCFRQLRQ